MRTVGELDRYDVEAMIRDAGYRYASSSDLAELRTELRVEVSELRRELEELRRTVERESSILNERTAHLV